MFRKRCSVFTAKSHIPDALEEDNRVLELMKNPKLSDSASSTVMELNLTVNGFWGVLYCRVISVQDADVPSVNE